MTDVSVNGQPVRAIGISMDRELIETTRGGLFGGPVDSMRRFTPGPTTITAEIEGEWRVDAQVVVDGVRHRGYPVRWTSGPAIVTTFDLVPE